MECTNCNNKCNDKSCKLNNSTNNQSMKYNNVTKPNTTLPNIIGGFLNITQKCNLKCKYCFVVQQPKDMEYQVAKDAVDFYANNAKLTNETPSINFFGGEPLLKWDDIIVPIIRYIRDTYGRNYSIGITTNGTLLNEDKLIFLKQFNVSLLVSMDGDKKTQDLNRPFHNGKGSFDVLKDKIPLILKYYPQTTFRATIDHDNVDEILNNYNFAIEQGYTNVFMIPNVFADWSDQEIATMKEQLKLVADRYMETYRQGKPVHFNEFMARKGQIMQLNNMNNLEYRTAGVGLPGFGRCGLGTTKFASIGLSGNIYSCQEMVENPDMGDEFKIGNIYTGVDDNKRWEVASRFDPRNIRRSDNKTCRNCILNKVCNGGCSINNYFATGDLEIVPYVLCEYYDTATKEYLRIMKTMAEEQNELFAKDFSGRLNV